MFLNQAISALIQTVLFMTIPFIWWLVTARKRKGFFRWLGWTRIRTDRPRLLIAATAGTLVAFCALSLLLVPALAGRTGNSIYSGMGWAALAPMLLSALYQTSFIEECVFRGFLLKRVGARFGITAGNIVQATLFGLIHMVPFVLQGMSFGLGLILAVFSGAIGFIAGWINEHLAGGSLWPSYALHALANVFGAALVLVGMV
ncbi:CPBP family intramembrane glutamic endopeptidase [Granulicoccus sp. GXG6511]|uniref:CPBP family intramembrane glutamic endopeptidase n=1 Tax=Granulicoccus sp. GXG6511 TaxID=3381351 RepID=UPI003D7C5A84